MKVRVIMALAQDAIQQDLDLPYPATLGDVLDHPRLSEQLRQAWKSSPQVGVFGEPRMLSDSLAEGDRIEIWRPLSADPRQARRARAQAKRAEARAKKLQRRSV